MMMVEQKDLIKKNESENYENGYRLVYFKNDDTYFVGAYCKTIEGFMIGFAECDPIIDEDDIPPFISIDDILNRSLNLFKDINAVAIYKTDGTCVQIKEREKKINIK